MSCSQTIRVGYVLKRYPRYSETFVVNEILAHEAAGLEVEIFALRAPCDTHFQDTGLSLDELQRTNMRVGTFSTQVVAKQIGANLIQRFAKSVGVDFEREPSVIATGQMIPLRTRFAALAAFDAGQLLQPTMQFFHLPAHVIRVLNGLHG